MQKLVITPNKVKEVETSKLWTKAKPGYANGRCNGRMCIVRTFMIPILFDLFMNYISHNTIRLTITSTLQTESSEVSIQCPFAYSDSLVTKTKETTRKKCVKCIRHNLHLNEKVLRLERGGIGLKHAYI